MPGKASVKRGRKKIQIIIEESEEIKGKLSEEGVLPLHKKRKTEVETDTGSCEQHVRGGDATSDPTPTTANTKCDPHKAISYENGDLVKDNKEHAEIMAESPGRNSALNVVENAPVKDEDTVEHETTAGPAVQDIPAKTSDGKVVEVNVHECTKGVTAETDDTVPLMVSSMSDHTECHEKLVLKKSEIIGQEESCRKSSMMPTVTESQLENPRKGMEDGASNAVTEFSEMVALGVNNMPNDENSLTTENKEMPLIIKTSEYKENRLCFTSASDQNSGNDSVSKEYEANNDEQANPNMPSEQTPILETGGYFTPNQANVAANVDIEGNIDAKPQDLDSNMFGVEDAGMISPGFDIKPQDVTGNVSGVADPGMISPGLPVGAECEVIAENHRSDYITDSQLCDLEWMSQFPEEVSFEETKKDIEMISKHSPGIRGCPQIEDGSAIMAGFIKELSLLNKMVLKTKREMETFRRQRKTSK